MQGKSGLVGGNSATHAWAEGLCRAADKETAHGRGCHKGKMSH